MKVYLYILLTVIFITSARAQVITEKHLDFKDRNLLKLNIQIADSIDIATWNKNEVYLYSSVSINENKDNGAYVTSFDETGRSLDINARLKEDYFKGKKGCCCQTNIYWKVMIPENTPIDVETIDGNITLTGNTREVRVKTISGYIDLAVPASRNANIDFSTISGTIYSNHNLAIQRGKATGLPVKISEKLNDGGPAVKLETISGDIYFRKAD